MADDHTFIFSVRMMIPNLWPICFQDFSATSQYGSPAHSLGPNRCSGPMSQVVGAMGILAILAVGELGRSIGMDLLLGKDQVKKVGFLVGFCFFFAGKQYLVGALVAMNFIFPWILGIINHPNWRTPIFQRGGPTTKRRVFWCFFVWFFAGKQYMFDALFTAYGGFKDGGFIFFSNWDESDRLIEDWWRWLNHPFFDG